MKSKFMDTLEDVLTSGRTSPAVRERVLWRKVQQPGKPDEVSHYEHGSSFRY